CCVLHTVPTRRSSDLGASRWTGSSMSPTTACFGKVCLSWWKTREQSQSAESQLRYTRKSNPRKRPTLWRHFPEIVKQSLKAGNRSEEHTSELQSRFDL